MTNSDTVAVRYADRRKVLTLLSGLMRTALQVEERRALLLRCGFGQPRPLRFGEIAGLLCLTSPQAARSCYLHAIEKTRSAIPGSELERYLIRRPLSAGELQAQRAWPPQVTSGRYRR